MHPLSPEEHGIYLDIGKTLRRARELHHISLHDAAKALHIRARYLAALEEGQLGELPGVVYARGYIMNYAEFLGVDRHDMQNRLTAHPHDRDMPLTVYEPTRKENRPNRWLVWGSFAVLLSLYGAWHWWGEAQSPAVPRVMPLPAEFNELLQEPFTATAALYGCLADKAFGYYPYCAGRDEAQIFSAPSSLLLRPTFRSDDWSIPLRDDSWKRLPILSAPAVSDVNGARSTASSEEDEVVADGGEEAVPFSSSPNVRGE